MYDSSVLMYYWRKNVRRLEGYTAILCVIEFPKALKIRGLRAIYPSSDDYDEALRIAVDLLHAGTPIGSSDIIIAAIALNRDLILVTMDKDFEHVKSVRPELKLKLIKQKERKNH